MSDLLETLLNAHGGVKRWQDLKQLHARATASGVFFSSKGQAGALTNVELTVDAREQRTTLSSFKGAERRAICTPSGQHRSALHRAGVLR